MSRPIVGMSPAEHFTAAQRQLDAAWQAAQGEDGEPDEVAVQAAIAHALLAIAGQLTPVRTGMRP